MAPYFAACAPGLEAVLAGELQSLGLYKPKGLLKAQGGVAFEGGRDALYKANLRLRTADRVLLRLGEFSARGFTELQRKAAELPWKSYLKPGAAVAFRVESGKSRLYHEGAIAERLVEAIGPVRLTKDRAGAQLIDVRLERDRAELSLDSSGEELHKRGYRLATAKAPLRETLAAGMLLHSGWDMRSPLLDPFCGSGTIAIEAALLAAGLAPGRCRRFAFMDWPKFDGEAWTAVCTGTSVDRTPRILASDRDAGAIKAAKENAERAGVAHLIEFSCKAVSAAEPPAGAGWLVTNPPYGVRLSQGRDVRDVYAQLGKLLRAKCPGWSFSVLCGGRLVSAMGLQLDSELDLLNGGLAVKLARGRV